MFLKILNADGNIPMNITVEIIDGIILNIMNKAEIWIPY
jgi:hypothetical protein